MQQIDLDYSFKPTCLCIYILLYGEISKGCNSHLLWIKWYAITRFLGMLFKRIFSLRRWPVIFAFFWIRFVALIDMHVLEYLYINLSVFSSFISIGFYFNICNLHVHCTIVQCTMYNVQCTCPRHVGQWDM